MDKAITEQTLSYRSTTNVTETRWRHPQSGMVALNVGHRDGIHSASFITHEDSSRRQTSVDIHHATKIEVEERSFESGGRMIDSVTILAQSGDVPIRITFYDVTINVLIDALLAERVGEDLVG